MDLAETQMDRNFKTLQTYKAGTVGGESALLEAVTVELGYSFEQVPEEQESLRVGVGMGSEDREYRGQIEVPEFDVIGRAVVQRCAPVLEQGDELGVDRAEHEQPARYVAGVRGQGIDDSL